MIRYYRAKYIERLDLLINLTQINLELSYHEQDKNRRAQPLKQYNKITRVCIKILSRSWDLLLTIDCWNKHEQLWSSRFLNILSMVGIPGIWEEGYVSKLCLFNSYSGGYSNQTFSVCRNRARDKQTLNQNQKHTNYSKNCHITSVCGLQNRWSDAPSWMNTTDLGS